MHVIGTAGHVDHGKSTLVEALTGIDPDRLREEKEREMTIVLGFAWLTMPGGEAVGIVDVPGHKDFIRNMLSGVGGIDLALLVIAADEGVMPQTSEHLAILDLLQVRGGVIALTKVDLVQDPEWLELVTADVMEQVEGTCMEDAPIVPVSAHTGQGLDELVDTLAGALSGIEPRPDLGRPRLPIDRVFTVSGFGTVVTGTLIDGSLALGQEVEIVPAGHTARIRGLQTHKTEIDEAVPGSRVAINLTGVSKDEIETGQVVTTPDWLRATRLVDVEMRLLAGAPRPLNHNTEVDFFSGAAELPARVRLLGKERLAPGESGWAQLRLSEPVALVRGDRFIVRQLSPSITIGGGKIVDPIPRRRHRRFRPAVLERLETLAHGSPAEIVLQALARRQPREARELAQDVGLQGEAFEGAVEQLLGDGRVLIVDDTTGEGALDRPASSTRHLISSAGWRDLGARMRDTLSRYHEAHPLRRGMSREALRSQLQKRGAGLGGRLFNEILARARREGVIQDDQTSVWLAGHEVTFSTAQQQKVDALLAEFRAAPYMTPSVSESVARLGQALFDALVEQGVLVQLSPDVVYLAETFEEARDRVRDYIGAQGRITIAEARDLIDASRKYAVALMEYLDDQRVTKRVDDERVLY